MFNTIDLLRAWSKVQTNRCKNIQELGLATFSIYLDGTHQLIRPKQASPSMSGIEQAMLCRALEQAINGSQEYSIVIKTVRKCRLFYRVWVEHEESAISGFAEEVDLCDALLRAYLVALEKVEHEWERQALEHPMFEEDTPITSWVPKLEEVNLIISNSELATQPKEEANWY